MFDVCVIGPVTRDVIRVRAGLPREVPGGVAHYLGGALCRLGLKTAVITKVAHRDALELLRGLRQLGAELYLRDSHDTTAFENTYTGDSLNRREQAVASIAAPFACDDLVGIKAKVFHLGPLVEGDMPVAFLQAVSGCGGWVSLDVQGLLRAAVHGRIREQDWSEKRAGLACVDVVKADGHEARLLSGEQDPAEAARRIAALGPKEVIITLGSGGSLILAGDRLYRIPAFRPRQTVDATGCGDSYMAGYIFHRLKSDDIAAAGRFAAALATLKLEGFGPFSGSERDVYAVLERAESWARSRDLGGSSHGAFVD